MSNFIADIAEGLAVSLGQFLRTSLPAYCDIETNDSATSLVTTKGALVSGIRLDGMTAAIGPQEFQETTEAITRALQSFLQSTGHTVDVFASRDPAGVRGKLSGLSAGSRKTCEAIGLGIEDVIVSNETELAKYTADESTYVALWTREPLLSKREVADGRKEMAQVARQLPPVTWSSQNMVSTLPGLRERHEATMRSILEDLRNAGIMCELLSSHEMLRVARMQIDPEFTQPDWTPYLIGDPLPVLDAPGMLRNPNKRELDFSDIQYPPVAWQLFPRDAYRLNAKYVAVGDRAYAPVFVDIPPREVMPFSALFEKLTSAQVPWRCMFRIDGGGMGYVGTKDALAQLLSITSSYNRRVSEAFKDLRQVAYEGNTNVRLRMSFCTWAPADNPKLLAQRASRLAQTVAAWGQCEVREVSGDPMLGMISTVPFVSEECAATCAVAPLAHVARMLPIMRPASPWKTGSIIFRTMDGRLMPFQPGSSLQTTWNYILFGRPGFGKSVQMLNLILSSCMQPGLKRLPRVGVVDIGPSSQYFVNMLRDSLPPNQRHQVAGFKLTMAPEHSINPFDTPLGSRFPTAEHKAFIINILTQVATPAESTTPYPRISELASKVVDDVYAMYAGESSQSKPKKYSAGAEQQVDALLRNYGFEMDRETTWWHVVDFLASKGHTHEATLAQRMAVPLMSDCVALSSQVTDIYGKIKVDSGETLTEAFSSLISSATRDFPNLATQTHFDIGEVRIAAINLEEVAKSGSRAADRQAAVMYLLASYALTKDYRLNVETVASMRMPSMYVDYHMKRARESKEELKWIAYDEFHRTAASPSVQASVLVDMREGRKYNVGVILSSQGADDFPATMREFATGTFIVDAGSEKNAAALQSFFGFNDTARKLLTQNVTGPKSTGAPLLVSINTKKGTYTQLLVSTLGLASRWALSTTAEDVLVRELVCAKVGAINGRAALVAAYPDGAQAVIERLRQGGDANAVDTVANDAISRWEMRKRGPSAESRKTIQA
jgi:intracellular multiplication protein IcmB